MTMNPSSQWDHSNYKQWKVLTVDTQAIDNHHKFHTRSHDWKAESRTRLTNLVSYRFWQTFVATRFRSFSVTDVMLRRTTALIVTRRRLRRWQAWNNMTQVSVLYSNNTCKQASHADDHSNSHWFTLQSHNTHCRLRHTENIVQSSNYAAQLDVCTIGNRKMQLV